MVSPTLLFLILFTISTQLLSLTTAQPLVQFCEPSYGNFTPNSTYHKNLNKALSSITPQSINSNGFYAQSAGGVNVVGLCRGDVKHADCYTCLNDSRQQLPDQCPVSKEAVGWYDNCMLRYSNRSIAGVPETQPSVVFYNPNNVTSGAARFDSVVVGLLTSLAGRAASGGSGLKFATGNVSDPESGAVYGLVQCLPGLSSKECNSCLGEAIEAYPRFFVGKIGGRILAPSCNFRYELSMFYNLTAADTEVTLPPPPVGAPAPAPAPAEMLPPPPPAAAPVPTSTNAVAPPTNSTNTQGEENRTSGAAIISTSYAAVLIVVAVVFFLSDPAIVPLQ